jgi:4-hydroxybenzoyl-CoA reductase subunit beta
MLPLLRTPVATPRTLEEALALLADPGARVIAGGTDILPNLKRGLGAPSALVSLHAVDALRGVSVGDAGLSIGAGTTLTQVAASGDVKRMAPSLAEAAESVASPQIRNMATLGGNVCLDTRCRWVNQSEFWRDALGGCLKSAGMNPGASFAQAGVCHVVPGGKRCVAAVSADTVPVLIALDATARIGSASATRRLPLADLYVNDGVQNLALEPGEILLGVDLPTHTGQRRERYVKWRVRGSIDFPLVSAALRFDLDGGEVREAKLVVGVLGARPKQVAVQKVAAGRALDAALATELADLAHRQCKPLENVPYEADHRRHMLRVLVRRAIEALADEA